MFADDDDAPQVPLPEGSLTVDSNAPGYRPADVSNKDAQAQKDLDDILNAALDELEDDDLGDAAEGGGMGKKEKVSKNRRAGETLTWRMQVQSRLYGSICKVAHTTSSRSSLTHPFCRRRRRLI